MSDTELKKKIHDPESYGRSDIKKLQKKTKNKCYLKAMQITRKLFEGRGVCVNKRKVNVM